MLSVAKGYDTTYLTGAVGAGRRGTTAVRCAAGEPPGLWYGAGAEALGLAGEVDAELMEAVYTRLLDPRDPAAHSRATVGRGGAARGGAPRYRSADDIYADLPGERSRTPARSSGRSCGRRRSARRGRRCRSLT